MEIFINITTIHPHAKTPVTFGSLKLDGLK